MRENAVGAENQLVQNRGVQEAAQEGPEGALGGRGGGLGGARGAKGKTQGGQGGPPGSTPHIGYTSGRQFLAQMGPRGGKIKDTTKQQGCRPGSNTPWAVGPANLSLMFPLMSLNVR